MDAIELRVRRHVRARARHLRPEVAFTVLAPQICAHAITHAASVRAQSYVEPMTTPHPNWLRQSSESGKAPKRTPLGRQVPPRPLHSGIFTNPRRVRILHDNFTVTRKYLLALCEESVGLRVQTLT
jgi:hypothetical protein